MKWFQYVDDGLSGNHRSLLFPSDRYSHLPHIGNTGTNSEDEESSQVHARGLIIRDLPILASNFRNQQSLSDYLKSHNIVGIADIDTLQADPHPAREGAQAGCILAGKQLDEAHALEQARAFPRPQGDGSRERSDREQILQLDRR